MVGGTPLPTDGRGRPIGWVVYSLGVYTITAYGTWAYAFGVLIEPIQADTGWSTGFLGAVYGTAMALTGLSAFWSGRLLDRLGPLAPLGLHAVVASGLMLAALATDRRWAFAGLFAIGAGLAGSTGFYSMTTVIAARSRPDRPDRAIAVLTLVGAFSSPVYLPVTAWLLTVWPWRTVGRALVVAGALGAVQAMVAVNRQRRQHPDSPRRSAVGSMPAERSTPSMPAQDQETGPVAARPSERSWEALTAAARRPDIRRALTVYFLAGAAGSTLWAYQVPMLQATGLSLAAAGSVAGLRGFFQLFGRMGLTAAVERHGAARLLQVSYLVTVIGGGALLVGTVGLTVGAPPAIVSALVFAVAAGAGFGASSPLQAIHARLHFDPGDLGLLMGMQGAVLGLAGGAGPVLGSLLRDATGAWTATIAVVLLVLVVSTLLLSPAETGRA